MSNFLRINLDRIFADALNSIVKNKVYKKIGGYK